LNHHLGPTSIKLFDDYWVLWYTKSNTYSVVSSTFKSLLDNYLASPDLRNFTSSLGNEDELIDSKLVSEKLEDYLKNCNQKSETFESKDIGLDKSYRSILKHYNINGKTLAVYYGSSYEFEASHPAIAHLCITTFDNVDITFDIQFRESVFFLFKDEELLTSAPGKDFHVIQGKFIMHLLCSINNNRESDWLGTFHGSTLTDGKTSILFIGASGKGKSTLCALLAASGFGLLADDLSPMLASNQCIYHNPLALSIKEGAFALLNPLIPQFDLLPTVNFKTSKGPIKYIPHPKPKKNHYPCHSIVLVNYERNAETHLKSASVKNVLETLIPDSWLSPNPSHAKQFLDWLKSTTFYELTYSDTKSVTQEMTALFKAQENRL
jgi:hypothetical protein